MILKLKRPKYYPLKVKKGFRIARTTQPEKSLGFATFKTKKVAKAMGKIWYGKFLGYDYISYIGKRLEKWADFI